MDELIFSPDKVEIEKQVEVMGSLEKYRTSVSYEEMNEKYNLTLDISRICPETDGSEFRLRFELGSDENESSRSENNTHSGDVPPVPKIRSEDIQNSRQPFYERLEKPGMQPYEIRQTIYQVGTISERNLKQRLNDEGHRNVKPGKQHGGVAATLVVLDEVTNEIERHGRGEDKTIEWIGGE